MCRAMAEMDQAKLHKFQSYTEWIYSKYRNPFERLALSFLLRAPLEQHFK